jgi:hypothetical protein
VNLRKVVVHHALFAERTTDARSCDSARHLYFTWIARRSILAASTRHSWLDTRGARRFPRRSRRMETARSFVREVEVWTPKGTDGWHRSVADASGARNDVVATDAAFRARERLVSRTLATSRPEMLARGGTDEDVAIALPTFRAQRLASATSPSVGVAGAVARVHEDVLRQEAAHLHLIRRRGRARCRACRCPRPAGCW